MEKYSLKQGLRYVKSDYHRYFGGGTEFYKYLYRLIFGTTRGWKYSFWLRMAGVKGIIGFTSRRILNHLSTKYSIQIPAGTKIGYGFYIGHGMGVVINGGTTIGNNVNISQFLSIGTNKHTPAIIGDNVYIGPHVSIVEDVHIGNNVAIGAGSVVVKDIPANCTAAGVPAKVISNKDSKRFIQNKCDYQNAMQLR